MAQGKVRQLHGLYRAVVKDNKDPKNLRRLKLQVQTHGGEVTEWAWPVISTKRPPAIGTGVYAAYLGSDPEYPVWLGEFGKPDILQGVFSYGSWYSTVDQTASAINTAYIMTVNNKDYQEGISVKDSSKFTVDYDATYNLQFSAQLQHRTGGGGGPGDNIWIWLKKNGNNVANSATKLYIPTGKYQVAAWNFIVKLKKNDYVQLAWSTDTTDMAIEANGASGPTPAVPSLIVTMNQIA
jgi:hypothetical protein